MISSCPCTWFTTRIAHTCTWFTTQLARTCANIVILHFIDCIGVTNGRCFCGQALHVAGQVAGASVSTSPLPYGTMTSQCEALGSGTRQKLSSWLVNCHNSTPDNPVPSLPAAQHFITPKVRRFCQSKFYTGLLWISVSLTRLVQVNSSGFEINRTSSEPCSVVKLPPASPFDNFLKAAYRTQQEM